MDFRYKNALQHTFSVLPYGHRLNYFFQRYVTKSYPSSEAIFKVKVDQALQHHKNFIAFNELINPVGKYYEFGAGWDLIIPLAMSGLGFEVHCIDLRALIVKDLINDSLVKFKDSSDSTTGLLIPIDKIDQIDDLKKARIQYFAPVDASQTPFKNNTYDFMSTTSTMEHIPPSDMLQILKESERILKPGGILSMLTDYKDHWSYFDRSLTIYNFLKYSKSQWSRYNPDLHYQNRLRHSDYMSIIEASGFEVVKESVYHATDAQLKLLDHVSIAEEFSSYSREDLTATGSEIVLRKKAVSP